MVRFVRDRFFRFKRFKNDAIFTLNGWRFADLKRYIDSVVKVGEDAQLGFLVLEREILRRSHSASSVHEQAAAVSIAVVSCLPPDATGLARFTMEHVCASNYPIHVFSPVRNPAQFLRNSVKISKSTGGATVLYPISTLPAMAEINGYKSIVFVLGNSDHNISIFQAMDEFCRHGNRGKVVCYLHDPCCHNIVQLGKELNHGQYREYLKAIYPEKVEDFGDTGSDSWRVASAAVKAGMLGVRSIVDLGVKRFIVNSQAAADIVADDLAAKDRNEVKIGKVYHPVFELEIDESKVSSGSMNSGRIVIGTFGLPGASKKTNDIIDAVLEVRKKDDRYQLIVAGYNALNFCQARFGPNIPDWLAVHEPLSEFDLQHLMAQCDIAVQLREVNLGESSGVIPTLLRMGKTVISSPVGAFLEYEGAVIYFDGTESALAELLLHVDPLPYENIAQYVGRRDVSNFARDFLQVLENNN